MSHSVYRSRFVKALCVRLPAILAHRVAAHRNAVGVVDQPVEDAIGQSGIANLFVPARDRELRSQDRQTHLVAVFADLPEVAALIMKSEFSKCCYLLPESLQITANRNQ